MKEVGVYEAKTHLPRLLADVEKGETVVITRHGRPIARLIPANEGAPREIKDTIAAIREFRKGHSLNGISISELIETGRKY